MLAGIALGLGLVFILGAVWNVHNLSLVDWMPIRTFLSAMLSTLTGLILVIFGWQGVRRELEGRD